MNRDCPVGRPSFHSLELVPSCCSLIDEKGIWPLKNLLLMDSSLVALIFNNSRNDVR